MDMLYAKQANGTIDEVGQRLEDAVKTHQFGLLGVIDIREKMKEKGVAFDHDCRIYEVCNPHQAAKVLSQEMLISTMLPCRISLYEKDGQSHLATMLPTEMLRLFDVPELRVVAEAVQQTLEAIVDDAAG